MANQTIGLNVQNTNPYSATVTNSGTLIGNDIELVYNQATVLSRNDLALIVRQFLLIIQQSPTLTAPFGPSK